MGAHYIHIEGSTHTVPLYIVTNYTQYAVHLGYEDCYNIDGVYLGKFDLGLSIKTFNSDSFSANDVSVVHDNGTYRIVKNETPLSIAHLKYNCKDVLVAHSLTHYYMSEERAVFEAFLSHMSDTDSIVQVDSLDYFDRVRVNEWGTTGYCCENLFKHFNCFVEDSIHSEKRCNYRRISDRIALTNWDKIKHIKHNQILLRGDRITQNRAIKFLLNRLNQKSITAISNNQYKQLIQMKL